MGEQAASRLRVLVNLRLYDYETYIDAGFVVFDHEVRAVGPMSSFCAADYPGAELIDGGGRFLLPGLINFHTHVYSALARGFDFKRSPKSFSELLQGIWWRLDHFLTLEDLSLSASAYGYESLLKGVVGLVDHHASGTIAGSTGAILVGLRALGLHGITCFEVSDRFDLEAAISEGLRAMNEAPRGLFGLHASMTLSDASLKRIIDRVGPVPIHCHVSESLEDQQCYPESPVTRLDRAGLLRPGSLLAHCVHVNAQDVALISAREAVVAVNPRSNLNNGVGQPPYTQLLAAGIPLVVGTDGLGADVARSWQDLYFGAAGRVDLRGCLANSYDYYKTLTGRRLGRFVEGYAFDAMLVDYRPFTPITAENAFSHVLYGVFDQMHVHSLWIGGQTRVAEGQVLSTASVDWQQVRALWQRIEDNHGYSG